MGKKIPYKCTKCGFSGRLWREYNTFADQIELLCGQCAHDPNGEWVGKSGYLTGEGDQLEGGLVPAIPTPDGKTFFGYTSVPQELVLAWYKLPCTLRPERWQLMQASERNCEPRRIWTNGGEFRVREGSDGVFVCRLGVPYNGKYVETIPDLLQFFVENSGDIDVAPRDRS